MHKKRQPFWAAFSISLNRNTIFPISQAQQPTDQPTDPIDR